MGYCPTTKRQGYILIFMSPSLQGGGPIDFDADPIGVSIGIGVGMTLSCLHNIFSLAPCYEFYIYNLTKVKHFSLTIFIHIHCISSLTSQKV